MGGSYIALTGARLWWRRGRGVAWGVVRKRVFDKVVIYRPDRGPR